MVKSAIITAAGSGRRFGEAKQFKKLHGKPLYQYSLDTFIKSRLFDEIILVIPNSIQEKAQKEIIQLKKDSIKNITKISEDIAANIIEDLSGDKLNESSIKAAVSEVSKNNLGKYL